MLNYSTSSSIMCREVDPSTCLLYQADPDVVDQVVGSRVAPPEYFEPQSREIPELDCVEKDGLARWSGLLSAGAHQ
jgi:hypothetical protein